MLALAGLLASPSVTRAQATELRMDAPPGCSSLEVVEAEIRRLVGATGDLVVPGARAVNVTIAAVDAGFRLELRSEAHDGGDAGTRVLADPSCTALADAAALIIAMMIDPDAALLSAASPPPPPPPVSSSALDSTTPSARTTPPFVVERARDLGSPVTPPPADPGIPPLALGAGAALDVGLLPTAMGGLFAELVVRVDSLDLRASVTYLFPSSARPIANVGADVSAVLGRATACGRPLRDPWLGLCVGLEGGALLAQPVGVAVPAPGAPAGGMVAAVAGVALPWVPVDLVDVELALEIVVPLYRPRFEIASPDPAGSPVLVHEPGPAGLRVRLAFHFDLRP